MARQRGRLDPGEVKRAMAEEQSGAHAEAPFHSPFAAARGQLEKLVPSQPAAGERQRRRAERSPPATREEPSELARVRAAHKAAREALARSVAPIRRPGRGGPGGEGGGPGGDCGGGHGAG